MNNETIQTAIQMTPLEILGFLFLALLALALLVFIFVGWLDFLGGGQKP